MRLSPRLALPVIALLLAAAGCGGTDVAVREVPGGPAELNVPGSGEGFAPAATATPTADADATATPDDGAEATPTPATTDPGAATGETGTGGTAEGGAAAPTDDGTADAPPPAGSSADEVADYCAENPGAC